MKELPDDRAQPLKIAPHSDVFSIYDFMQRMSMCVYMVEMNEDYAHP